MVLEKGKLVFNGLVDEGIEHYLNIHDKSYKEQSKINFEDNGSIAYYRRFSRKYDIGLHYR